MTRPPDLHRRRLPLYLVGTGVALLLAAEDRLSDGGDPPAFTWRRTFADTHHDFLAHEGTVEVGRIMRHRYGGSDRDTWLWNATGVHLYRSEPGMGPLSGDVETKREAIEALTAAWMRAKAWSARTGRPVR